MRAALVLFAMVFAGCTIAPEVQPMLPFATIHDFGSGDPRDSEFLVPEGVPTIHLVARIQAVMVGGACAPRLDDPPTIRIETPSRTSAIMVDLDERVATGSACEMVSKEANVTAQAGRWVVSFRGQGQARGSAGAS